MFKQIKKAFAFIFAIVLTIGCQSIGKKSQITIKSETLEKYNMTQNDKFGDKKTEALVRNTPLSKNDHFPMFYTFMVHNMVRSMYVRPKNKVVTVVDKVNSFGIENADSLGFVGISYPDESIILQELNRRFSAFQGYTLGLNRRSHDLKDAYMSSERIYFEEKMYLKEAFKKYKTGRDFRKAVQREIRYSYICNLIGPYSIKGTNVDSISQVYVKQVNSLKKELKNIIKTRKGTDKNVQLTVYDFNRFLSRKADKTDNSFEYQWETAEKNFKGETQEFLKFKILKENYGATPQYNTYFERFKKTCKDPDFIVYLNGLEKKNEHKFNQFELEATLSDTAGQSLKWADILAKNKGKKIYLMISPHPVQQIYGEKFTQNGASFEQNNTQIIFLSTERSKENWLKTRGLNDMRSLLISDSAALKAFKDSEKLNPKKAIPPFQSYHLSADDTMLLNFLGAKEEGFKLFKSVLIDENGKVVLVNAAEPSNMGLLLRQMKHGSKVKVPIP